MSRELEQLKSDPAVLALAAVEGGRIHEEWSRPGTTTPLRQATSVLIANLSAVAKASEAAPHEGYLLLDGGHVLVVVRTGRDRYLAAVVNGLSDAGPIRRRILSLAKEAA